MMQRIIQNNNLDEVSFIRPILIVLLVIVHCFTVFNGGWPPFDGYQDCTCYMWLSRTCYSFMLETFIFLSGYVWAYQVLKLRKNISFKSLIKKKAERLLLPSVVFSLIYMQTFDNVCITELIWGGVDSLRILSGVGHLWYLPVLFWCFIFLWIIERIKISDKAKLLFLLIIALLPYPSIPLQLSRVPYYLLFFFAGYKVWQYGALFRINANAKLMIASWLAFAICFVGLRLCSAYLLDLKEMASLETKIVLTATATSCKVAYSSIGVFAIYATAVWYTKRCKLSKWYINIGSLCFGVYIYQEFIIRYLYYYTNLPISLGHLALPWITFIITLILSLLLSKTTKSL